MRDAPDRSPKSPAPIRRAAKRGPKSFPTLSNLPQRRPKTFPSHPARAPCPAGHFPPPSPRARCRRKTPCRLPSRADCGEKTAAAHSRREQCVGESFAVLSSVPWVPALYVSQRPAWQASKKRRFNPHVAPKPKLFIESKGLHRCASFTGFSVLLSFAGTPIR